MTRSWISNSTEPCLWMAAGLINYRLCDRDFDCDHCPLDAALRGDPRWVPPTETRAVRRPPADCFPPDRSYSAGHLWVQILDSAGGTGRLGLDAFAAGLIGRLIELRLPAPGSRSRRSIAELQLDSGRLPLNLPIPAETTGPNPLLQDEPDLALTEPYGRGWLLALAGLEADALGELLTAEQALGQARSDLRLFRRQVALEMLSETTDLGRCMADGGHPLTDLRQILGGPRLRSLLHDLVH
jgi:glycine cleavage system H protein